MANEIQRVHKGPASIDFYRILPSGDEILFAAEVPSSFTIPNGITQTVTMTRNRTAEKVRGEIYTSELIPDLNITVGSGKNNPLYTEFILGNTYEEEELTIEISDLFRIPEGTGDYVRPAATVETDKRFGLLENDTTVQVARLSSVGAGFPLKNNITLTRVTFNTSSTLSDNEFGVGLNGALQFAENLRGESVALGWQRSVKTLRKSEAPTPFYHIVIECLDNQNVMEIFDFPRVLANLSGKSFDPDAETWELSFYISPFAGQCRPFEHYYTPLIATC